jgi:hypothetical protein
MLALQSCTDPLYILPGSPNEAFPTPSDGTYGAGNIKVEEDEDVIEENFVALNKELDTGKKQEEVPRDITLPHIKAKPNEVSYMCVCLLLDTFYRCPGMSFFLSLFLPFIMMIIIISVFLGNCNNSTVWNENVLLSLVFWGVGGVGWLVDVGRRDGLY